MAEYIQVITTVISKEEGERVARALLEKRLAACVQLIGPIASLYWWRGKIEQSEEWLCIAKTESTLFSKIEETIKAMHSYEVPEILAIPLAGGSTDYLKWVEEQVAAAREENTS